MKKSLITFVIALSFITSFISIFGLPNVARASTETLRPDVAGDSTLQTIGVGCASNYQCVNETVADGDTSYLYVQINPTSFSIAIKENGVSTFSAHTLTTSYVEYSDQWNTRPSDGGGWTITDINALQIGSKIVNTEGSMIDLYNISDSSISTSSTINSVTVHVTAENSGSGPILKKRVTQVYVVVDYTLAGDLTSTNFIIRNPIIGTGGDYGTSTNFKMFSSGNTLFSGVDSSSSFIGHYGFLYYPYVTTGTLTATPVGAQIDLAWPASTAGSGWSVSGYNTGKASVSGGPYTYTSVGNVTSYSYTELAPGNYCFVVQTLDALGNVIGTSNESCATVSTVITFDLDTSVADGETNPPYSVALGTITTIDTRVSGTTDSINMIIAEGDTNATGGVVVIVHNANGTNGLVSTSASGDNINSADGTMADGTENYGLCVITVGLSGFSRASPYNTDTCATNSETNGVQALTTAGENILTSTSSPIYNAHAEISVNAAISNITPAHSDYTDTLTFIATSTF